VQYFTAFYFLFPCEIKQIVEEIICDGARSVNDLGPDLDSYFYLFIGHDPVEIEPALNLAP